MRQARRPSRQEHSRPRRQGTGAIAERDTARAEPPDSGPAGRYDAFISYARKDTAFAVERLSRSLGSRGQEVWLDVDDIPGGAKWRDRVRRGIEACKAFLFVISPDSVSSTQCLEEIEDAVALNKLIVPVVYRDVPEGSLPPAVAEAEWVFLRDEDEMAAGIDRLVEALETDLQWRDEHTRLAGRVREWTDAQRDRSYLLRGADLREAEAWLSCQDGHKAAPTREQGEFIARGRKAAGRRLYTIIRRSLRVWRQQSSSPSSRWFSARGVTPATGRSPSCSPSRRMTPPTSNWRACWRSRRIGSRRDRRAQRNPHPCLHAPARQANRGRRFARRHRLQPRREAVRLGGRRSQRAAVGRGEA